jgi:hypothetical protein
MAATDALTSETVLYNAYCTHTTGSRIHTDSVIQKALLEQYLDHHVTATNCDLIKYAQTGHATARLFEHGPPHLFYRDFVPTLSGANGNSAAGSLKTTTLFASYNFNWQGLELIVYVVECQSSPVLPPCECRNYIVSKRLDGDTSSQGKIINADALILAAGAWDERSNQEILVFDRARWSKDQELWASVQNVSYDDVILTNEMKAALQRDIIGFFDSQNDYRDFNLPWKVRPFPLGLRTQYLASSLTLKLVA